jgi:hypothetical protein
MSAQQYLSPNRFPLFFCFNTFVSSILECCKVKLDSLFFSHWHTKIYEISLFSQLTVVHSPRKQHRIFKEAETTLVKEVVAGFFFNLVLIGTIYQVLLLLSMMILVVRRPVWVRPFCLLGVRNRGLLQYDRKSGQKGTAPVKCNRWFKWESYDITWKRAGYMSVGKKIDNVYLNPTA